MVKALEDVRRGGIPITQIVPTFKQRLSTICSQSWKFHNPNMNGWTHVMSHLNKQFNLNLTHRKIKITNNNLCNLYANTKLLFEKSSFGGDLENKTVTGNSKTWDKLIKAHFSHRFGKLMGKSFPF
ncbi:uncharacterized protein VP01_362g18 [Puccinia sorghi]|uniref:Myb/SANT-like domain-containing protein n=1 Tax=Puccinia sorghi TaxID=27349 RepID=A0A0L6UUR3_9BASI|nr:uncharacterized protein VP01_362g18 [Puccinia sorghi]